MDCNARRISTDAIELIKKFENLELTAYICDAGKWTIGWGHVKNVKPGMAITLQQAEMYLEDDLAVFEREVENRAKRDGIPLSQSEFDALVSFAFNLGTANLFSSTLWKNLRAGDLDGAARQFKAWIYVSHTVKLPSGRKVKISEPMRGLCARRMSEAALFRGEIKYFSYNNEFVNETVISALQRQIVKTTDREIIEYYERMIHRYQLP